MSSRSSKAVDLVKQAIMIAVMVAAVKFVVTRFGGPLAPLGAYL